MHETVPKDGLPASALAPLSLLRAAILTFLFRRSCFQRRTERMPCLCNCCTAGRSCSAFRADLGPRYSRLSAGVVAVRAWWWAAAAWWSVPVVAGGQRLWRGPGNGGRRPRSSRAVKPTRITRRPGCRTALVFARVRARSRRRRAGRDPRADPSDAGRPGAIGPGYG